MKRAFWGALALSGCASVPPIEAMQTDARCYVWAEGSFGHVAARVERAQTVMFSNVGEIEGASFTSATDIDMRGERFATYGQRQLVIRDFDPVTLGERSAIVHGTLANVQFEFNARCTDRDAALGVTSLVYLIAASAR